MKILVKCSQCGCDFLKSVSEINRMERHGYKNHFCSNICSCRYNKKINEIILPKLRREEYYKNPKTCLQCNTTILYEKKDYDYCSRKCSAIHTQRSGGHCKWDETGKAELRKLAKKNPWFNGTIRRKNGIDVKCPVCGVEFYKYNKSKQLCCSKKCSNIWINKTGYLKGKTGGYREKGGRGKQGWYKGYFCNSSWELAWVIYQLEHDIKFTRNTVGFEYEFEGRKYKFYPDFQMDESNVYVEIKAYIDKKNSAKISFFPRKLELIGKKDIKPYLDYVIKKYGKNFIELYESKSS